MRWVGSSLAEPGIFLPTGMMIFMGVAGANRDPEAGRDSDDAVDIDREVKRHWGFGGGLLVFAAS
jgi:cytochrome P450